MRLEESRNQAGRQRQQDSRISNIKQAEEQKQPTTGKTAPRKPRRLKRMALEKDEKIRMQRARARFHTLSAIALVGLCLTATAFLMHVVQLQEDADSDRGRGGLGLPANMRTGASDGGGGSAVAVESPEARLGGGAADSNHPPRQQQATISELEVQVAALDAEVRRIKSSLTPGTLMETDPNALKATSLLQDATRQLLHARYGPDEPYRVRIGLQFQKTMPNFDVMGPSGSFIVELAPSSLQPHSIHTYLEVARRYKGGAFHRTASHVLQVMVRTEGQPQVPHLAFQEYSPEFPHQKGTVGYAGRPSGPEWYVSIQDNTKQHGPGTQQKANPHEADSCFGKVVEGFDSVILGRVKKMPGGPGFINDPEKQVKIVAMTVLIPDGLGGFVEWREE